MFCPSCGNQNEDGASICMYCGTSLTKGNENSSFTDAKAGDQSNQNYNQSYNQAPPNNQNYNQSYNQVPPNNGMAVNNPMPNAGNFSVNGDNIPPEYKPISMWGYFGYSLLFNIPLIGFILLIVFSVGGTKNYNLRNYARSFFCWIIIAVVIFIIAIIAAGGIGALGVIMSSGSSSNPSMYY